MGSVGSSKLGVTQMCNMKMYVDCSIPSDRFTQFEQLELALLMELLFLESNPSFSETLGKLRFDW